MEYLMPNLCNLCSMDVHGYTTLWFWWILSIYQMPNFMHLFASEACLLEHLSSCWSFGWLYILLHQLYLGFVFASSRFIWYCTHHECHVRILIITIMLYYKCVTSEYTTLFVIPLLMALNSSNHQNKINEDVIVTMNSSPLETWYL